VNELQHYKQISLNHVHGWKQVLDLWEEKYLDDHERNN